MRRRRSPYFILFPRSEYHRSDAPLRRGVFFVEMSSSGDGQDEDGRGSTAGAGEGLRGDKIK